MANYIQRRAAGRAIDSPPNDDDDDDDDDGDGLVVLSTMKLSRSTLNTTSTVSHLQGFGSLILRDPRNGVYSLETTSSVCKKKDLLLNITVVHSTCQSVGHPAETYVTKSAIYIDEIKWTCTL